MTAKLQNWWGAQPILWLWFGADYTVYLVQKSLTATWVMKQDVQCATKTMTLWTLNHLNLSRVEEQSAFFTQRKELVSTEQMSLL